MAGQEFRQISRREALATLAAGTLAAQQAGAQTERLRFVALDHVQIGVPDSAKSARFYAGVFGGPVWKHTQTPRRYVKFGDFSYIAIEQRAGPPGVDHFAAGFGTYSIAQVHDYLQNRGIAYKDFPSGRDLYVTDPDGIRVELAADPSWLQLEKGGAVRELQPSGEPIFSPVRLDHILLNVAEPEKSAAFYEKIFGPVTQRANGRIWFDAGQSRIGLLQTPEGQQPGVNHFCVLATNFDYQTSVARLEQAGAKLEKPEVAGAPEFRDPDGILLQIMGPRKT